jgi:hypothetical protein
MKAALAKFLAPPPVPVGLTLDQTIDCLVEAQWKLVSSGTPSDTARTLHAAGLLIEFGPWLAPSWDGSNLIDAHPHEVRVATNKVALRRPQG